MQQLPPSMLLKRDKDYKVEVAAPGMTKEDFKIHINEDNDLVISMEKENRKYRKVIKKARKKAVTCVANSLILNSNRH